jgi:hypothetical protein
MRKERERNIAMAAPKEGRRAQKEAHGNEG